MIISKTLTIKTEKMPPKVDFILSEIRKQKIEPIRWAIVDIQKDNLILSVSGYNR